MVAVFAKRLVLGASLGLGVLDVAWLDLALAPRVLASTEPAHEASTQPAPAPQAEPPRAPAEDTAAVVAAAEPTPMAADVAATEPTPMAADVAPVVAPPAPTTVESAPSVDERAPSVDEPAPTAVESAPTADEPARTTAQPATTAHAARSADAAEVDEQVFFASMRAELGDDARTTLAAAVRQAPAGATYLLAGHADYRGEETYNRKLGLRRAQAVAAHLVELGVARERVRIGYIGEEQPNAPDELWRDRRVDIQISGGPR